MTKNNFDVEKVLKDIINKCSDGVIVDDKLSDFNLSEDLGFDSIRLIELVVEIETKFNIEIDDEFFELDNLSSYTKLVNYINDKLMWYYEKN